MCPKQPHVCSGALRMALWQGYTRQIGSWPQVRAQQFPFYIQLCWQHCPMSLAPKASLDRRVMLQTMLRALPLLLLLGAALPMHASCQSSSAAPSPASSNSSAPCQPDTQWQVLALFGPENTTSLTWDAGIFNLSVTWQPAYNSSLWQQLGCLTDVSFLWINASTPLPSLPDGWGEPGKFRQLQYLGITGNFSMSGLPAAWARLGAFPALQQVSLDGCQLRGALPVAWGRPGAFQNLTVLSLTGNSLSSGLQEEWAGEGSMPKLRELYLSGNALSSTLPASWGASTAFQGLETLAAEFCGLNGTLPDAWSLNGSFPQLRQLLLFNNSLEGTLPASYGAFTAWQHLRNLTLEQNSFHGTLPASWAGRYSFPALQQLTLGMTNISGALPEQWGQGFARLRMLSLTGAALNGTLPSGWSASGSWPALKELWLDQNDIHGTLPAEYAAAAAFPKLQLLVLSGNAITGTLPAWDGGGLRQLATLYLDRNNISGVLPPQWGTALQSLQNLDLSNNRLEGALPLEWAGSAGSRAFPQLQSLLIFNNSLHGPLPSSWGSTPGAMSSLTYLDIDANEIDGTLPDSWGSIAALPQLYSFWCSRNRLSGTLPATWASPNNFQSLSLLVLGGNNLVGRLPAFGNRGLVILSLANNAFEGDSGSLWNSTAPLALVDISSTRVSGGLPQLPAFNATPEALNVDNTSLTGIIPLPWLGPGGLLARIIFEGQALWDNSIAVATWRKEVCVTPGISAAAHSKAVYLDGALDLKQRLNDLLGSSADPSLAADLIAGAPIFADLLAGKAGQEQGLQDLCRVVNAKLLIGMVWGVFLGMSTGLVIAYSIIARLSRQGMLPMRCERVKSFGKIGSRAAQLFCVLIYTYDAAKDTIVLSKVLAFHRWYGYTLLGVTLGHHVYRGMVLSLFLTRSYSAAAPEDLVLICMRCAFAVVSCPIMVLFTLYMDICTYMAAILGMQSPSALDVDSYADMRSLVMSVLQSLPIAISTTVIFLEGNSPFWGEYYTVGYAALILVGSLSSIMVGLGRLLYVAHSQNRRLLRTFVMVFTGQSLHCPNMSVCGWRSCVPTCGPDGWARWSTRTHGRKRSELPWPVFDTTHEPKLVDLIMRECKGEVSVKIMPVS